MANRIEILSTIPDTRAKVRQEKLRSLGFSGVEDANLVDVYTIDSNIGLSDLERVANMLANPVTQDASVDLPQAPNNFDWAIEIGYQPGVTDNVATTAKESIEDLFGTKLGDDQGVYTSQLTFLTGNNLSREEVQNIAESLANPLIQRISIKDRQEYSTGGGMGVVVPKVRLDTTPSADIVDILRVSDDELVTIGKQGISNEDGSRRGPLALDLTYMKRIQEHFLELGRNPRDVELESIAQTWSEHCKHTIFADSIDDVKGGLFKTYIKRATEEIRAIKGENDFCASVFVDNSGAIIFDDNWLITDKVETHNSPSALDPFGGSITGIVGVNRDTVGFGLGAKPILNRYGFLFADPEDKKPLYKGEGFTQKMLSPRAIMEGVIEGVNEGGNCSGIPTTQGFMRFDERYKGKPLVYVGTVGLIPRVSAGRPSHEKKALPGDYAVMVGGRVGKDGIHGATFSSEAMDSGSPATAVQIGDPITQKKLSDAIVKEARDMGLYTSITDNGAGGISCSVAEMAEESGGCYVKLDDVPTKYPGLEPWEIWISESQERMTLSVPKENWEAFNSLMESRGVEATIIGEFTDSGKCVVEYNDEVVMDLDMDFLHDGLPQRPMKTKSVLRAYEEPKKQDLGNLTSTLHKMLGRPNITSFEFVTQQYDHEVQGGSVLKPLQGRGRVNSETTVVRPVLDSQKGVVVSQGVYPSYSDIDTYHMAAAGIDTAVRNAVAAGASLDRLALLDNFCWCSPEEEERLHQLKRAAEACYDYAVAFGTPFISGKDSMHNDFKGFDENGEPTKISIPPTLLISSIGVIDDFSKSVSLDSKMPGDFVYVLGDTFDEMGGSEYYALIGEEERGKPYIGNKVPKVDAEKNIELYRGLEQAISDELVASAQSVGVGGLGVALAKTAMGGRLGMQVSLAGLGDDLSSDELLFSESQGRVVVTVAEKDARVFEETMGGNPVYMVGRVIEHPLLLIGDSDKNQVVYDNINSFLRTYKERFEHY
ncbi:phosphoribosylformylglycinamidine synthase [Candidatus Woesearchaeota archaeon]|nr:phosphoribosylformylglycinamidine synthase [Candidatus Woesearchaeota archaeon]